MKRIFILSFFLFSVDCFSQQSVSLKNQQHDSSNYVSIIGKLNIENATKDGIYLKGYVVDIEYDTAKKLNNKIIKVTGRVTILKGLKNDPPGAPIRQARMEDTRFIESPKIEIIKE